MIWRPMDKVYEMQKAIDENYMHWKIYLSVMVYSAQRPNRMWDTIGVPMTHLENCVTLYDVTIGTVPLVEKW